jgi:hypothetical protein
MVSHMVFLTKLGFENLTNLVITLSHYHSITVSQYRSITVSQYYCITVL